MLNKHKLIFSAFNVFFAVMSPRLSSLYAISEVLIEGSNDPYGVLSLTPDLILTPETDTGSCKYINLVIQRTGKLFFILKFNFIKLLTATIIFLNCKGRKWITLFC